MTSKNEARRSAKATGIRDERHETVSATWTSWSNWIDDFRTDAARVDAPATVGELRHVIEAAVSDDVRLKPIGSGHSNSNAAQPSEGHRYVDLSRLSGLMDLTAERATWRHSPDELTGSGSEETAWVRVKSGTRIQELTTQLLPPHDLGLLNVGTFDGQTVSGAVNTGTHGTGVGLGSFGDMVRSADLFVIVPDKQLRPRVELWRLEPADGPTDPATTPDSLPEIDRLVQDDELFHAMIVGFGSFGIAYSYLLAVRPYYWLKESARQTTVAGLKAGLEDDLDGVDGRELPLLDSRHPWAFVNIAWAQVDDAKDGEPQSLSDIPVRLVRQDELSDVPPKRIPRDLDLWLHPLWPPMRRRDGLFEAVFTRLGTELSDSGKAASRFVAKNIDQRFIEDDDEPFYHTENQSSAYYRVIRRIRDESLEVAKSPGSMWDNTRIGGPPNVETKAISFDMSVPLDQVGVALDTLLAECEAETIKLVVPLGIRFSAGSNHMLSASYGRPSAFLELGATVENDRHHERDVQRYKRVLSTIGAAIRRDVPAARPHLGKHHGLDHATLLRHYPQAETWLELQGLFNFTGTWTSPFTAGFDGQRYRRSAGDTRARLEQRLG